MEQQNAPKAMALTRATVIHHSERQGAAARRVEKYYVVVHEATEAAEKAAVIKAAKVYKEATKLFASTTTLTHSTFMQAYSQCEDDKKIDLVKGQMRLRRVAMRRKFPSLDLAFSHNSVDRPLDELLVSVRKMLDEERSMGDVPTEAPRLLRKLVDVPQVGTITADRVELQDKFAELIALVDDAEIRGAATQKAAARARKPRADLEMSAPALGVNLLQRDIEYKYNTGWFKGSIIAVADGTTSYKFTCTCKGAARRTCKGHLVPQDEGWVKVHFFYDDVEVWLQLLEGLLNGGTQGSWRLLRD
jgi:hypothetical protein